MKKALVNFIRLYQKGVSPLLGVQCLYYPTCSQYAVEKLEEEPILKATSKITLRLLSCNPVNAYLKRRKAD